MFVIVVYDVNVKRTNKIMKISCTKICFRRKNNRGKIE